MDFPQIMKLQAALEKEFQRVTDIRNLESLPFKEMILQEGMLIYDSQNQTPKK
jgi:hypothetical protein